MKLLRELRLLWMGVFLWASLLAGRGAIPVHSTGTGMLTFDTAPSGSNWTTAAVGGAADTIQTAAEMDAAVQLLSTNLIIETLGSTATFPPAANGRARWNSRLHFLQTRPAGVAAQFLMATLTNATASNISSLTVSYSLGFHPMFNFFPNALEGYRVYFSTSGQSNGWQFIPGLSGTNAGLLSAAIDLGAWAPGAPLFLLWADDNGVSDDVAYSIDNFFVVPPRTNGVIAITAGGTGTNSFDGPMETRARGWSGGRITGVAAAVTNAAQLDDAVQLVNATNINQDLWTELSDPEIDNGNDRPGHNTAYDFLQSRPVGNAANLLLAILQNNTGSNVAALRVSYRFAVASSNVVESLHGFRACYSFSGEPGSWRFIPEMTTSNTVVLDHVLDLENWRPGAPLHLLWADDNGPSGANSLLGGEGTYTIDDLCLTPAPTPVRLRFQYRATNDWALIWPDDLSGYVVEHTDSLTATNWQRFSAPLIYGGFHTHQSFAPLPGFFRLVRP